MESGQIDVAGAVAVLYHDPDPVRKAAANTWLTALAASPQVSPPFDYSKFIFLLNFY